MFSYSLLALAFLLGPTAQADDVGIPLTVQVITEDGSPIRTATVRHPQEAERHRVNSVTGVWEEQVLYLMDGSEFPFDRGTVVKLEVSALGYQVEPVEYKMRRRRNKLVVQLKEIELADDDDWMEDAPMIQFDRDKPLD